MALDGQIRSCETRLSRLQLELCKKIKRSLWNTWSCLSLLSKSCPTPSSRSTSHRGFGMIAIVSYCSTLITNNKQQTVWLQLSRQATKWARTNGLKLKSRSVRIQAGNYYMLWVINHQREHHHTTEGLADFRKKLQERGKGDCNCSRNDSLELSRQHRKAEHGHVKLQHRRVYDSTTRCWGSISLQGKETKSRLSLNPIQSENLCLRKKIQS